MDSANRSVITLKGSTEIVAEFFYYAVNTILYQRGIYPPDEFEQVKKYGLPLLVSKEKGVKTFIDKAISQSNAILVEKIDARHFPSVFIHFQEHWLLSNEIQKLVCVIVEVDTEKPRERWSFDVHTDNKTAQTGSDKPEAEIRSEIQQIIRQITASVTYLPLIEVPCKFDILVYTKKSTVTPGEWEESAPKLIDNADEVKLRNFSTKIHKIDSMVSYLVDA